MRPAHLPPLTPEELAAAEEHRAVRARVPSWGKTLAQDTLRMFALRVDKDEPFDPALTTTRVYAPCCGRIVLADAVVDLREIPGTVIRGGNHLPPKDHAWACDGCLHILYRDPANDWTLSRMMEARGAPAALVHDARAMEIARDIDRERSALGLLHYPVDAREGALAALIAEVADATA